VSAVMYFSETRHCDATQKKVLIFGRVLPVHQSGTDRPEISRVPTRCSNEWDCLNRIGAYQSIPACHLNLKPD
jgi:hypothetical protein